MSREFHTRNSRIGACYTMSVGAVATLSTITTFEQGRWVLGFVILLGALLVVLYGRLVLWPVGVSITDQGIVLRGALGRRLVRWDAVRCFEVSHQYPWRAFLVVGDGKRLRTTGLGGSGIRHRVSMADSQSMIDELNQLIETHPRH